MRILMTAVVVIVLLALCACTSVPIQTDGPNVARFMVRMGTKWALAEKNASAEQALQIQSYIIEGRNLVTNGSAPVSALDQLATYLNSNIDNEFVRRAIQQGIEFVKSNITIPVDGLIPTELKIWVVAVLDGAIQGCAEYAAGLSGGEVPAAGASDRISFR